MRFVVNRTQPLKLNSHFRCFTGNLFYIAIFWRQSHNCKTTCAGKYNMPNNNSNRNSLVFGQHRVFISKIWYLRNKLINYNYSAIHIIERHKRHIVISWPIPNQWLMIHLYFDRSFNTNLNMCISLNCQKPKACYIGVFFTLVRYSLCSKNWNRHHTFSISYLSKSMNTKNLRVYFHVCNIKKCIEIERSGLIINSTLAQN